MTYTPSPEAIRRVANYVRPLAEKDEFLGFRDAYLRELPEGVLSGFLAGELWPDKPSREVIADALVWKPDALEWIARGGEPTAAAGPDHHRFWRVTVTVERVIEAPLAQDALAEVCDPIRGAFSGGVVGIVDTRTVNMAQIARDESAHGR